MSRRLRTLLICVMASCIMLACTVMVNASEPVDSGPCGTNVGWYLSDDGVLDIIGEGASGNNIMKDYDSFDETPWYKYADRISAVVLSGIDCVGENAFNGIKLEMLDISNEGIEIKANAFANTYIDRLLVFDKMNCDADCFKDSDVQTVYTTSFDDWASSSFANANANPLCGKNAVLCHDNKVVKELKSSDLTVDQISPYAFYNCDNLESISLNFNIYKIGEGAFANCDNLTDITIDTSSLIIIKPNAFSSIDKPRKVTVDSIEKMLSISYGNRYSNPMYSDCGVANSLYVKAIDAEEATLVESITIDELEDVNDIKDYSICSRDIDIVLDDITDCYWYKSVKDKKLVYGIVYGDTVHDDKYMVHLYSTGSIKVSCNDCGYGYMLYYDLDSNGDIYIKGGRNLSDSYIVDTVIIPKEILGISENNTVKYIADGAFAAEAGNYKSTDLQAQNYVLSEDINSIGAGAFENNYAIESITIDDAVTNIGEAAFKNCSNLKIIEIPDGVTEIEPSTFMDCSSLSAIELPENLKTIGSSAFQNSGLAELELPATVKTIRSKAFYNTKLQSVTIPCTVKQIGEEAFGYVSGDKLAAGFGANVHEDSAAESYCEANSIDYTAEKHDAENVDFLWSLKGNACRAEFTCDTCGKEVAPKCTISSEQTKAPSCTVAGQTTYTASYGTHSDLVTLSDIKALGHNPVKVAKVYATCQHVGYSAHYECDRCQQCFTSSTGETTCLKSKFKISKQKHSYTKKVISKKYLKSKATKKKAAVYYYSCKWCGKKGTKTFSYGSKKR